MKAIVKVSQLVMDDGKHHRGDVLDLPDDRITSLGSSVERVVPTVAVLDEKDVKITELEARVVELESLLADKNTRNVSADASGEDGDTPTAAKSRRGRK